MDGFPSLIFIYRFFFLFLVDHPKLDPITLNHFLTEPNSIGIHFTLVLKKADLVQLKVKSLGHHHSCHGNSRPTHMKAYAFVFANTHITNRQCKSSPLANHDSEKFLLCLRRWSSSATLPTIPLPYPKSSPSPLKSFLALSPFFFPFFFFFFFSTSLINKTIKKSKTSKKIML